ncbi:MAG: hypothetical protein WCT32_00365 [Patescibacteria group bacterium]|jgi:hypothetical protein
MNNPEARHPEQLDRMSAIETFRFVQDQIGNCFMAFQGPMLRLSLPQYEGDKAASVARLQASAELLLARIDSAIEKFGTSGAPAGNVNLDNLNALRQGAEALKASFDSGVIDQELFNQTESIYTSMIELTDGKSKI